MADATFPPGVACGSEARRSRRAQAFLRAQTCGLSLLKGQSQRYHTEYVCWRTGVEPDEEALEGDLKTSLDILECVFAEDLSRQSLRITSSPRELKGHGERRGFVSSRAATIRYCEATNARYAECWVPHAMARDRPWASAISADPSGSNRDPSALIRASRRLSHVSVPVRAEDSGGGRQPSDQLHGRYRDGVSVHWMSFLAP